MKNFFWSGHSGGTLCWGSLTGYEEPLDGRMRRSSSPLICMAETVQLITDGLLAAHPLVLYSLGPRERRILERTPDELVVHEIIIIPLTDAAVVVIV